jgi:2-phosphosulfolactate phosphatase
VLRQHLITVITASRRMRVYTTDFVAGAASARGIAIIIDVFRAFSVAAHAFARGVETIVPTASIDDARLLKHEHPDWLLIGERHGLPLRGFDCGNSPTELERFDLQGRTLIHTTHAGTQGLAAAVGAHETLTGALVNAQAIVNYVLAQSPPQVTLVRMGQNAHERCQEDDLCADILARRLAGERPDVRGVREQLRAAPSARKFFDPDCDWAPERDFELCTQVDEFDFVLRLERDGTHPRLTRVRRLAGEALSG